MPFLYIKYYLLSKFVDDGCGNLSHARVRFLSLELGDDLLWQRPQRISDPLLVYCHVAGRLVELHHSVSVEHAVIVCITEK